MSGHNDHIGTMVVHHIDNTQEIDYPIMFGTLDSPGTQIWVPG